MNTRSTPAEEGEPVPEKAIVLVSKLNSSDSQFPLSPWTNSLTSYSQVQTVAPPKAK